MGTWPQNKIVWLWCPSGFGCCVTPLQCSLIALPSLLEWSLSHHDSVHVLTPFPDCQPQGQGLSRGYLCLSHTVQCLIYKRPSINVIWMNEWVFDGEQREKREVPQQKNGQEGLLVPPCSTSDTQAELVSLYWKWPLLLHSSELLFLALISPAMDFPAYDMFHTLFWWPLCSSAFPAGLYLPWGQALGLLPQHWT